MVLIGLTSCPADNQPRVFTVVQSRELTMGIYSFESSLLALLLQASPAGLISPASSVVVIIVRFRFAVSTRPTLEL